MAKVELRRAILVADAMETAALCLGLRHELAPLGLPVIAVAGAMVDLGRRVDPYLAGTGWLPSALRHGRGPGHSGWS